MFEAIIVNVLVILLRLDYEQFFLLIAALIFSAGYYSAPIFFTIQGIWIVLGRCLFHDSKRSIGEVLFTTRGVLEKSFF